MNQILHIFRKDVRHHWPEIILSLAAILLYVWVASVRQIPSGDWLAHDVFLWPAPLWLVPLAWAFLLVRVVQGESLVGDRQFWVTRPNEWKELLAAKLLFVLVFLNVPLLILQASLLRMAGFPLAPHISGLLWLQLLWTVSLILPVAALASVTASTGQFLLGALAVVLFLTAAEALLQLVPNTGVEVGPFRGSLVRALVIGACFAVVFWQYSRRRTAQSRFVLVGVAAAVLIITVVTPYRLLIERTYPQETAGHQLPVQLAFDPVMPTSHEGAFLTEKNKVLVRIPLLVSGITSGFMVRRNGTKVSISVAGGRQWVSDWWHGPPDTMYPGRPHSEMFISIDRDFFEQVKLAPAKVHISFALRLFQRKGPRRIVAEAGGFTVPGDGRCIFGPIPPDITCSFPLKNPYLSVTARSEEMTCPPQRNGTPLPHGIIGYGHIAGGTLYSFGQIIYGGIWMGEGPAEFGLSPVSFQHLFVMDWGEDDVFPSPVCPGTPLTASALEELQRARRELDIEAIRLADYELNGSGQ